MFAVENQTIYLSDESVSYEYMGRKNQGFTYDRVFDENWSNQEVFGHSLGPLIPNLFEGFNVTCMAYGITGAGKTFTMLGHKHDLHQ